MATVLWTVAVFACLGGHSSGEPALIAKSQPLRIMAFGDSITAGVGARGFRIQDGGYRGPLSRLLAQSGYHVTFVGARSDYSDSIVDRAHEGWPGYVVRSYPSDPGPGQLFGALAHKAMQDDDPDVVLLMAGTNDLLRREHHDAGYTLTNILQSMDLLIGEIVRTKPNVFVIVAPVVESPKLDICALRTFAGSDGCVPLNNSLKDIVDAYARHGYRVSLAPAMMTAVPRDAAHFPDGIHPSGIGGYTAVANVWLHAIEDITQPARTQQ
jgi:lysophospholipase L1-like esterase